MLLEALLILAFISPVVTNISTRVVERWELKIKLVGEDAHKQPGRYLPKSGGLGFIIGWSISIALYLLASLIFGGDQLEGYFLLAIALTLFSAAVGFYDDLKRLGGIEKVALTAVPGLILAVTGYYSPYIYIPILGNLRMSIIYPILLPVIFAVSSNAINMTDTFTGIAPGVTAVLSLSMIGTILALNSPQIFWQSSRDPALVILLITFFSLIGYLPRNFHPGRAFNGDTGSLSWGTILALGAVWGKAEFFLALAAMPIVTNGFTILTSIKGIIEHHNLKERPTIPNRERNTLRANPKKDAPITLAHLLTLRDELCEREIVIAVYILVSLTSILSMVVAYLSIR